MTFAEFSLYSKFKPSKAWPILVWGSFVKNLEAKKVGTIDKEDGAFGLGFEVGSKKHFAKLGLGYFEVEANAVPAAYMDSNLFDGQFSSGGTHDCPTIVLRDVEAVSTAPPAPRISSPPHGSLPGFGENVPSTQIRNIGRCGDSVRGFHGGCGASLWGTLGWRSL